MEALYEKEVPGYIQQMINSYLENRTLSFGERDEETRIDRHLRSSTKVSHRADPVEYPLRRPPADATTSGSRVPGFCGRRRTSRQSQRLNKHRAATHHISRESPRMTDASGPITG